MIFSIPPWKKIDADCRFPLESPVSLPCHFVFGICFYHNLFCLNCMLLFQPNNALPPFWKIFLAWLFREFSWIAFFLQAACGREIEWRTSHFVLRLGGKAERLQEKCQDLNNHCCWTEMNTELLFIIISLLHTVLWSQSNSSRVVRANGFFVELSLKKFVGTYFWGFLEDLTATCSSVSAIRWLYCCPWCQSFSQNARCTCVISVLCGKMKFKWQLVNLLAKQFQGKRKLHTSGIKKTFLIKCYEFNECLGLNLIL